jgi:site-specific DNA recombinase
MAGAFDVLLITDQTRLSRSNADLSKMIDRLRARGVRVIGIQDGFDSFSRTARMQAGLRNHVRGVPRNDRRPYPVSHGNACSEPPTDRWSHIRVQHRYSHD